MFRPHAYLLRGTFRYLWRQYQGALDDLQCVVDTPDLPVEVMDYMLVYLDMSLLQNVMSRVYCIVAPAIDHVKSVLHSSTSH